MFGDSVASVNGSIAILGVYGNWYQLVELEPGGLTGTGWFN